MTKWVYLALSFRTSAGTVIRAVGYDNSDGRLNKQLRSPLMAQTFAKVWIRLASIFYRLPNLSYAENLSGFNGTLATAGVNINWYADMVRAIEYVARILFV